MTVIAVPNICSGTSVESKSNAENKSKYFDAALATPACGKTYDSCRVSGILPLLGFYSTAVSN